MLLPSCTNWILREDLAYATLPQTTCGGPFSTEGIPRALELLAGILDRDPTASLPRLLSDKHLFGEQVVERLVEEGYRRLRGDERRVMEALAVFDRPVEERAVAYLLYPWFPGVDVRADLRHLVHGYFVTASRVTGEYSLHPLDREYAYHQLLDGSGTDAYTQRNLELRAAGYYASIRKPESEWKAIGDLAPQLAEFEHRVRAGDYNGACRVLEPIDIDYLFVWSHFTRLVELREKLLGHLTEPDSQATNLASLGLACHYLGQVDKAIEFYVQALFIAREVGDHAREGRYLGDLGHAYFDLGRFEQAVRFYEAALAITREIGDRRNECHWLDHLGLVYRDLGQVKEALKLFEEALAIEQEIGLCREEGGGIFCHLGIIYRILGQPERAIRLFEEALAIDRGIGHRRGEGNRLGHLGNAYRSLGQVRRAIDFYEQALVIAREIGFRRHEALWLDKLGGSYYSLGQFEQAIEFMEQALGITREIGDQRGESYNLVGLSEALLATKRLPEARQHCTQARELDVPETSYRAALVLGIVLLRQCDRQCDPSIGETFADAAARCQALLSKTAYLCELRYALATTLVGQAVCDLHWQNENERTELLAPALAEYRPALQICAAPGVVKDALHDLELIRAAGIKGLEPVFELLTSALNDEMIMTKECDSDSEEESSPT